MKDNRQKFLNLYKPVHARFERFCRARAFGDMPYEDLINESLLVAFRKINDLKNEKAFLSFLIGTAVRILANSKRKMRPQSGVDEFVFQNHADPSREMDRHCEVEFLYKALAQLPEKQREALILFEITGYSIKEIMQIQESGESAVKQRLARGRKELARIVKLEMQQPNSHSATRNSK